MNAAGGPMYPSNVLLEFFSLLLSNVGEHYHVIKQTSCIFWDILDFFCLNASLNLIPLIV